MSFDCNNGVCYINSSTGMSDNGIFPLPNRSTTWTIYGKSTCPFCTKIRQFFDGIGIKYLYYDIEKIPQSSDAPTKLGAITGGYNKVPMVFFYGTFIGGYTETLKYLGVS